MEKVNVSDWDKTIFAKDSTVTFCLWCILHYPKVLKALPAVLKNLPAYWRGKLTKTQIKEIFYHFLRYVPDVDRAVERFWDAQFRRIKGWYYDRQRSDDIIISASPEFLLSVPTERLGVRLIASRVDKTTGETEGENCWGAEKVRRLREAYPEVEIAAFYSDSRSDTPLAELADVAYLVKGEKLLPW